MLFRGLHRLDRELGGGGGERGKDSAGVKPAHSKLAEDVIPIEFARLELRRRGIAAVRITDGAANAKTTLGEVEAVADGATDAVILAPLDELSRDAALHDEILDEMADLIIYERGADSGSVAETFPETARRIVFAASLP